MRDLTTPVTNVTADKQYVQGGRYFIASGNDGTINLAGSYYEYDVVLLPSEEKQTYRVYEPDMPPAFRTKLKELHQMVVSRAGTEGELQPGTDSDDFS